MRGQLKVNRRDPHKCLFYCLFYSCCWVISLPLLNENSFCLQHVSCIFAVLYRPNDAQVDIQRTQSCYSYSFLSVLGSNVWNELNSTVVYDFLSGSPQLTVCLLCVQLTSFSGSMAQTSLVMHKHQLIFGFCLKKCKCLLFTHTKKKKSAKKDFFSKNWILMVLSGNTRTGWVILNVLCVQQTSDQLFLVHTNHVYYQDSHSHVLCRPEY